MNRIKNCEVLEQKNSVVKKVVFIISIMIIVCFGTLFFSFYKVSVFKKQLDEVKSHFSSYVITVNDSDLYDLVDNKYIARGKVYKDVVIKLREDNITSDTKYFYSEDLNSYITYDSVIPSSEPKYDKRYLNYIPYNQNIITKENFILMDNDKNVYSFEESMSFPIIINNYDNRYYVEYNDRLLSIKNSDIAKIVSSNNSSKKNRNYITTLCYHRIYDVNDKCNDSYTCMKKDNFNQEMKYLKDNNYFTLTINEMYMYLNNNIQVEKAVLITFDDGYLIKNAIDVLERYDLNATSFIITGDFKDYSAFDSSNLEKHSHTDNLHKNNVCKGGNQGGAILCYDDKTILNDLINSRMKLGNPIAMAFPFYDYNERAINLVKQAGFKMAFVGRAKVMGKSYLGKVNMYKIPRMTVWDFGVMSFNTWKSYL